MDAIKEPLTISQVKSISDNSLVIKYEDLQEYKNAQDLFNKNSSVIVLLQMQHDAAKIGHFIALLDYPDYIEHFDSYGLTIDDELLITGEDNHLKRLLTKSPKKLVTLSTSLQKRKPDVETCGRWCGLRCRWKSWDQKKFLKFFNLGIDKDLAVTLLTYCFTQQTGGGLYRGVDHFDDFRMAFRSHNDPKVPFHLYS